MYPKQTNRGGRPRKVSVEKAAEIAKGWFDLKRREPHLSQKEYARDHGIDDRTFRHYLAKYAPQELAQFRKEQYEAKMKKLNPSASFENQDNDAEDDGYPCSGLMLGW